MAINPAEITTIRVDQLAPDTITLTSLLPHQVGTDLKQATIQELVDLVATQIGVSGGVGFLPISVTDGQQLPDVPEYPSFFLCGIGTFLNINGYPDVITTEPLNAIMSLSDHWELAVEIPITAEVGVQTVTGSAVDNTDPLNPIINFINDGVQTIVAGTNITVDNTDPLNPIVSSTGGGGIGANLWNFKTKTTITTGDPSSGHLIWNNAIQVDATQINISHLTEDGYDIELFFTYLKIDDQLILQDKDDNNNSQIWTISATPTIIPGGYVEIPVTLVSAAGTGNLNFANNHSLMVVKQSAFGGGGPIPEIKSSNFTGRAYTTYYTYNNIVVTDNGDNSPYIVFVAHGTATIGGVAYAVGSLVYRYYDGISLVSAHINASEVLTPTLQEVTDEGNETTNPIRFESFGAISEIGCDDNVGAFYFKNEDVSAFKQSLYANNTVDRQAEFQDKDGILAYLNDLAFVPKTSDFTPVLYYSYSTSGTITVTDPDPININNYIIHVIGGTTTIGGVGYTSGALVYRFYNGSSWISTDMNASGALTDTVFGTFVNSLTAKNTLVDADLIASSDSADSNKAKKTSWLNVWTNYIKGKADALYATLSMSAYSMRVNNTNAIANATETTYRANGQQTYSGTITWTGTTAPSGATTHTYNWVQVGNLVTLTISLAYAVAGSGLTSVLMNLPSDCPNPVKPTGLTGASNNLYFGTGALTQTATTVPSNLARVILRSNAANNGFEISCTTGSGNHTFSSITIQYYTS